MLFHAYMPPLGLVLAQATPTAIAIAGVVLVMLGALVVAVVGACAVRARKQHEEADAARREMENRWESLMASIPDIILAIDVDGHITYANRVPSGIERHTLVGGQVYDFVADSDVGELTGIIDGVVTNAQPESFQMPAVGPDGASALYDCHMAPVLAEGVVTSLIMVCRDITEEQRVEKQLRQSQKMEAVGRLAGGVAHDFNNVLTVIQCNALLVRENLPDDSKNLVELDEVLQAAGRAGNLTQQLLAFSRRQMIKPEYLDLRKVVEDMTRMLRRIISENIKLELKQHDSALPVVADAGQMEQVVMNLVLNARDAMFDGGQLTLETNTETLVQDLEHRNGIVPQGEYVVLIVRDSGAGMPPEVLSQLFEPYFTTKEVGKGSGLGLATVYGILEQHKGSIVCNSSEGEGAEFTIYLPVAKEGRPAEAGTEDTARPRTPLPKGKTILIVEDEVSVRTITKRLLERQGYNVLVASDGAEAVRLSENHRDPIHMLFTDVVLPGANGAELAKMLGAQRPDMKVLFTSGYTDSVVIRHGVRASEIEFLHKPFSAAELSSKVRKILFD